MNVFELFAKISLDDNDYKAQLNEAESSSKSIASGIGSAFSSMTKIAAAGVTAAASGIGVLVTKSVQAYADYEQLVGGVETLFGVQGMSLQEYAASVGKSVTEVGTEYQNMISAQETVMDNASNAYKTAGLSANEYMEQVTSFAAALTSSLEGDTQAAADKADMAITDMADNANKMGASVESIQNAYQGFAKQNYTMLDNLKLGYGGTKEEMERLLEDASKISGIEYDVSSYADIVDAIHVVQTEMGITGTTAKEASTTISGSISMMKGAWTNLVAGLADDNADMGQLIDNLIESIVGSVDEGGERVGGVINNVIPRVEQALTGVGTLITEMLPIVFDEIPALLENVLPDLLDSGANMITTIIQGISDNLDSLVSTVLMIVELLATTILENLPTIIEMGAKLLISLARGIAEMLPSLIPTIIDVILTIVEVLTDPDNLSALIDAAIQIILALVEGIIEALPRLIEAAPVIIENLVTAIIENLPLLLEAAMQLIIMLVQGIISNLPKVVKAALQIVTTLVTGIINLKFKLWETGVKIVTMIGEAIGGAVNNAKQWGKDLIDNFISGIVSMFSRLVDTVKNVAGTVKSYLGFSEPEKGPLSNFHTYAPDMMDLFAKGIRDNESVVTNQIKKSFDFGSLGAFDMGDITATSSATPLDSVIGLLSEYLPQLSNTSIVLDTGALVGQTTTAYDKALGRLYAQTARGV